MEKPLFFLFFGAVGTGIISPPAVGEDRTPEGSST